MMKLLLKFKIIKVMVKILIPVKRKNKMSDRGPKIRISKEIVRFRKINDIMRKKK